MLSKAYSTYFPYFSYFKVREFNLPRHRKLNLINHQRYQRYPVDQFEW